MRRGAAEAVASLVLFSCALRGNLERPGQHEIVALEPDHFVRLQHASSAAELQHASASSASAVRSRPHLEVQVAEDASSVQSAGAVRSRPHLEVKDKTGTRESMLASQLALLRQTFGTPADSASSTNSSAGAAATSTGIPPCSWVPNFFYLAAVMGVLVCAVTAYGVLSQAKPMDEVHNDDAHEDVHAPAPDHIGEDLFGLVLSSMVRNMHSIVVGTSRRHLRVYHIVTCVALLMVNLTLQVYLLDFMHYRVAAVAEENVRRNYDKYEIAMYGNDLTKMNVTVNGYHRGRPEFFKPDLFKDLDLVVKEMVCHIPFSQPAFFIVMLLVWTLTCVQELRQCWEQLWRFMVNTGTCDTMADSLAFTDGDGNKKNTPTFSEEDDIQDAEIVGLTTGVKVFVVCVQVLPRVCVTLVLLWNGCLWLAATPDFTDIVTNVVALAFILQLKDLVYITVAPDKAQRETQKTAVVAYHVQGSASFGTYFGTYVWLMLSILWVLTFIFYLQTVLPIYKWDVRAVCEAYLESQGNPLGAAEQDDDALKKHHRR